jgi:Fe-S-cluster containining protein
MNDLALIQIVDAAVAEAVRKSGARVVCRPGCTQCCMGPFPITRLDALRIQRGLDELAERDPERAVRVRERARQVVELGMLDEDPCPALDPETGLCELYDARPITCRIFGPPVRGGSGAVGVCELCFQGASDEEIAACAVEIEAEGLDAALVDEVETTVALALHGNLDG